MSIEQIVGSAGDGKLRDDSECSKELRVFLSETPTDSLRKFAEYCLSSPFNKSGQVLQDVVNELGRRLEFAVVNGRYSGTTNAIGNDGLWRGPDGHDLVVEVKTTDTYRISLNTIAGYRDALCEKKLLAPSHSMLVIVGRDDTGEIEAQIRGSRHAWDMRLISVDALLRLLEIKESTEESETAKKIRGVLRPAEYTRLDSLIDVLFTAAKDVEDKTSFDLEANDGGSAPPSSWEFTAPALLASKRAAIIAAVSQKLAVTLIKRTRATYWDTEKKTRAVCTLSKRYTKETSVAYWYAYHPGWDEFVEGGEKGVIALGAMDLDRCFVIPHTLLKDRLDELNTTIKPDGTQYWHVKILEPIPNKFALQMPKTRNHVPLDEFALDISSIPLTSLD